jgi:arylsulfatase A-like enzyme
VLGLMAQQAICYSVTPQLCFLLNCRFGYDAFSLSEATMGNVMQQAGYMTAHYGKW